MSGIILPVAALRVSLGVLQRLRQNSLGNPRNAVAPQRDERFLGRYSVPNLRICTQLAPEEAPKSTKLPQAQTYSLLLLLCPTVEFKCTTYHLYWAFLGHRV